MSGGAVLGSTRKIHGTILKVAENERTQCSKQEKQALLSVIPRDLWSWTKGVPFCGDFTKALATITHAVAEASEVYWCLMDTQKSIRTCGYNICQNT